MAYNVLDVVNKLLLCACNTNEGAEFMSNMKLQKMLYYQQGCHLAYFDEPLFDDEIEAWMYGPVVPEMYEFFKSNGCQGIPPLYLTSVELTDKEETLFGEVFRTYNDYSSIGLMNLTHKERPWKEAGVGVGHVISKESMKKYFNTMITI